MTGDQIVNKAREFLGVRYVHQGRSREGVDCIGLPVCIRAELGLAELDASGYARRTTDSQMLDFCKKHLKEIHKIQLSPGDIVVQMSGMVRHMAVIGDYPGGGLSIIHSWLPNKKVSECRLGESFLRDVRGCFRFPEVTG